VHGWPPGEVKLRNVTLPGVRDRAITGDKLRLVVVSHGRGGDFVGHQDTAEVPADAGFVVAAINHPGDTATDIGRSDDLSALIERPTDMQYRSPSRFTNEITIWPATAAAAGSTMPWWRATNAVLQDPRQYGGVGECP